MCKLLQLKDLEIPEYKDSEIPEYLTKLVDILRSYYLRTANQSVLLEMQIELNQYFCEKNILGKYNLILEYDSENSIFIENGIFIHFEEGTPVNIRKEIDSYITAASKYLNYMIYTDFISFDYIGY